MAFFYFLLHEKSKIWKIFLSFQIYVPYDLKNQACNIYKYRTYNRNLRVQGMQFRRKKQTNKANSLRCLSSAWTYFVQSMNYQNIFPFRAYAHISCFRIVNGFSVLTWSKSTESSAYISSVKLNLKLNCHVDGPVSGSLPVSSKNVRPNCMIFNKSTLHRSNWYW